MVTLRMIKVSRFTFLTLSMFERGQLNKKTPGDLLNPLKIYLFDQRCCHTFNRKSFGKYAVISKVGECGKAGQIPDYINAPSYYMTGEPPASPTVPQINNEDNIKCVTESCNFVKDVFEKLNKLIKIGTTTDSLDLFAHSIIIENGTYPSPLNYLGYPRSICTSVNNIAIHGIPDNRPLSDGDIISIDITVFYKGFHGDSCRTFVIGEVDNPGLHLVSTAELCRNEAISICKPGLPFSAIGEKIEQVAAAKGVTVVPAVTGHGIASYFHGPPDIYHCYNDYPGVMKTGMIFTIEPVVSQGSEEVVILEDGWTTVMFDNGRAAQFEHTILITDDSHQILT